MRQFAPSAQRNRAPIAAVLSDCLPAMGVALEIASGTGEHAAFFAASFPGLIWQPSDRTAPALASIAAHRKAAGLANLLKPIMLNAASPDWPVDAADAILCINMIHISPWEATEGLLRGAGRLLPTDGILYLYGPFKEDGAHTAESNRAFDEDLRARNPAWGVRDLADIVALGKRNGLVPTKVVVMPANNRSVVFRKIPSSA